MEPKDVRGNGECSGLPFTPFERAWAHRSKGMGGLNFDLMEGCNDKDKGSKVGLGDVG